MCQPASQHFGLILAHTWRILHGPVEIQKFLFESQVSTVNIFQHEKRNSVSTSSHVMFYLLYISTYEIPNHFTFAAKGAICCVTIATAIFSHLKITVYFHV